MAAIRRKVQMTEQEREQADKCYLCGDLATGYWAGENRLHVCGRCAESILPKLIANCAINEHAFRCGSAPNDAKRLIERVESRIWKAVAWQAGMYAREAHDRRNKELKAQEEAEGLDPYEGLEDGGAPAE